MYPDKQPIHQSIQRGANQQYVKRSEEQALRLQEPLSGLKACIAWGANDDNFKITTGKF